MYYLYVRIKPQLVSEILYFSRNLKTILYPLFAEVQLIENAALFTVILIFRKLSTFNLQNIHDKISLYNHTTILKNSKK